MATATTLAEALQRNRDLLPAGFEEGTFCDNFDYRCHSAARTWQRPHAQDNLM
jgi:phosphatidylinositol glycan class S